MTYGELDLRFSNDSLAWIAIDFTGDLPYLCPWLRYAELTLMPHMRRRDVEATLSGGNPRVPFGPGKEPASIVTSGGCTLTFNGEDQLQTLLRKSHM